MRRGAPCWRLDLGAINMPFESVLHALRTTGVNCVDMMPSNDPYWPRSAIVGKRKLDDMEESLLKEMEDVFFPQINEAARDHGKLACNPHHVKIIEDSPMVVWRQHDGFVVHPVGDEERLKTRPYIRPVSSTPTRIFTRPEQLNLSPAEKVWQKMAEGGNLIKRAIFDDYLRTYLGPSVTQEQLDRRFKLLLDKKLFNQVVNAYEENDYTEMFTRPGSVSGSEACTPSTMETIYMNADFHAYTMMHTSYDTLAHGPAMTRTFTCSIKDAALGLQKVVMMTFEELWDQNCPVAASKFVLEVDLSDLSDLSFELDAEWCEDPNSDTPHSFAIAYMQRIIYDNGVEFPAFSLSMLRLLRNKCQGGSGGEPARFNKLRDDLQQNCPAFWEFLVNEEESKDCALCAPLDEADMSVREISPILTEMYEVLNM